MARGGFLRFRIIEKGLRGGDFFGELREGVWLSVGLWWIGMWSCGRLWNLLMLDWLRHCFSPLFRIKAAFFESAPPASRLTISREKNHLIWGRKRGQVENLSLNRTKVQLEESE